MSGLYPDFSVLMSHKLTARRVIFPLSYKYSYFMQIKRGFFHCHSCDLNLKLMIYD